MLCPVMELNKIVIDTHIFVILKDPLLLVNVLEMYHLVFFTRKRA